MKSAIARLFVVLLAGVLVPEAGFASVRFDGLNWYMSEDPDRLVLNEDHQLVWKDPAAPDMIAVRLPAMRLTDVGDTAEVVYKYKGSGTRTGVASTDPTMLSGTGDIRIGLFDSNGRDHVDRDGIGYADTRFRGYLGYHVRVCPHLPVGIKRRHSDAIPGKFMKRTKPYGEDGGSLVSSAASYGKSLDLSGFGLALDVYSPLVLKIERTAPKTLVFTVTLNGVTYRYVDDEPDLQPNKIDVMAMYFPNPIEYSSITFAGCWFSCMPVNGRRIE